MVQKQKYAKNTISTRKAFNYFDFFKKIYQCIKSLKCFAQLNSILAAAVGKTDNDDQV
jgi:hypothetical protein